MNTTEPVAITPIAPQIIVAESCHWYSHLGEPIDLVPYADAAKRLAKGEPHLREPTLADARKYGLLPSVSLMANQEPMPPPLMNWFRNLYVDATIAAYVPGMTNEEMKAAVAAKCGEIEEASAQRGTELHAAIQRDLAGDPYAPDDPIAVKAILGVRQWIESLRLTAWYSERATARASIGLGGTIDFAASDPNAASIVIADFKSKVSESSFAKLKEWKHLPKKYLRQLAGYQLISNDEADAFYVLVISQTTGEVRPIEIPEDRMVWARKSFMANFEAWVLANEYDPRTAEHFSKQQIMEGKR